MRRTTRGSLSFCAWRRSSSSFEMAVLFPFANVGRISPIITHCADYVELFMRTYIALALCESAGRFCRSKKTSERPRRRLLAGKIEGSAGRPHKGVRRVSIVAGLQLESGRGVTIN